MDRAGTEGVFLHDRTSSDGRPVRAEPRDSIRSGANRAFDESLPVKCQNSATASYIPKESRSTNRGVGSKYLE